MLNTPLDAQKFAEELQSQNVAAAAFSARRVFRHGKLLQAVREGQIKVLCVSHWVFERSDLPAFNTVVLLQPSIPKPSHNQAILRAMQLDQITEALKLVFVVNAPEQALVNARVQRATGLLAGLWQSNQPPHPWQVLRADGSVTAWIPKAREWLENLHTWVQKTGRKPSYAMPEERIWAGRWKQGCKHLRRQNRLNAAERDLMHSCLRFAPQQPQKRALQELCAWMSAHARTPYCNSKDIVERRQCLRLSRARRRLLKGKLDLVETELLQSTLQLTVRPILRIMVAWVRFFERLPRQSADEPNERLQNRRWKLASWQYSRGMLTKAEMDLMSNCLSWRQELSERPRSWLVSLQVWILRKRRKPRDWRERPAEERMQAYRWKQAMLQLSAGVLSKSEADLMNDCFRICLPTNL